MAYYLVKHRERYLLFTFTFTICTGKHTSYLPIVWWDVIDEIDKFVLY